MVRVYYHILLFAVRSSGRSGAGVEVFVIVLFVLGLSVLSLLAHFPLLSHKSISFWSIAVGNFSHSAHGVIVISLFPFVAV